MSERFYTLLREEAPGEVVELGDGKGHKFRKQLVKFDNWVHPHGGGKKMQLDRNWAEKVKANFDSRVAGRVALPLGHPKTSSELAAFNRGELSDVEVEEDGLYGVLDVRDDKTASDIENDLLWDVSVSWDPNYVDKLSGESVGPALLHVGLLTDPYLKGMKPFEALSDSSNAIMLSEKEYVVSKIKNDRDFPVQIEYKDGDTDKSVTLAPGEELELSDTEVDAAQKQITEAVKPEAAVDADADAKAKEEKEAADRAAKEKADADAAAAEKAKSEQSELEQTKQALADANNAIALRDAESRYNTLLSDGKIIPAQKEAFMSLSTAATEETISLADGTKKSLSDLIADLIGAGRKVVNFGEQGQDGDDAEKTPYDQLSAEEKEATARLGVTPDDYNEVNGDKSTKKEAK